MTLHADYTSQSELLATSGGGNIYIWDYSTSGKNSRARFASSRVSVLEQNDKQKGRAWLVQ